MLNYISTLFKWYESEGPVGKDSLYDNVSLNLSDNKSTGNDSTTFPSSNPNLINSVRSKFVGLVKEVSG